MVSYRQCNDRPYKHACCSWRAQQQSSGFGAWLVPWAQSRVLLPTDKTVDSAVCRQKDPKLSPRSQPGSETKRNKVRICYKYWPGADRHARPDRIRNRLMMSRGVWVLMQQRLVLLPAPAMRCLVLLKEEVGEILDVEFGGEFCSPFVMPRASASTLL